MHIFSDVRSSTNLSYDESSTEANLDRLNEDSNSSTESALFDLIHEQRKESFLEGCG